MIYNSKISSSTIICQNLSNNYIKTIDINKSFYLIEIKLRKNQLEEFKITKYDDKETGSLLELDLSENKLESLSIGSILSKANGLKILNLNNNELTSINYDMLNYLLKIEKIYLNSNSIQNIDHDSLRNLLKLEYLTLSNNSLTYIDDRTFFNLIQLRTLNLSSNQIESFSSLLFVNLYNLKTLDISSNRLKFIDNKVFQSFDLLQNLYLNDNSNSLVFSPHTFSNLTSIVNIYLSYSVLSDVTNKKYLMESLRPNPERFLGDLTFFRSINILYNYNDENAPVDCLLVIDFLKKNIQVNLKDDYSLIYYFSFCRYLEYF